LIIILNIIFAVKILLEFKLLLGFKSLFLIYMNFKWLENLLSKESNPNSLDNNSKRYNDPMGLVGPLPYMSGGASKKMISELKGLKPAFMTGGDWSSYIKNVVTNEKKKLVISI